jgi:hypothetical protein
MTLRLGSQGEKPRTMHSFQKYSRYLLLYNLSLPYAKTIRLDSQPLVSPRYSQLCVACEKPEEEDRVICVIFLKRNQESTYPSGHSALVAAKTVRGQKIYFQIEIKT